MTHHVFHSNGHDLLEEAPAEQYDNLTSPVVVRTVDGRTEHYYGAHGIALHSVISDTGMLRIVVNDTTREVYSPGGWTSVTADDLDRARTSRGSR